METDKYRKHRVDQFMEKMERELKDVLSEVDKDTISGLDLLKESGRLASIQFLVDDAGKQCIKNTLMEDAFAGVDKSIRLGGKDTTYRIDNVFIDYYLAEENSFVKNFIETFADSVYIIGALNSSAVQNVLLPEEEKKKWEEAHKPKQIIGMSNYKAEEKK
jgi:hypothetical protein